MKPLRPPMDQQALEARLAGRLASALSASSTTLPHDVNERLRVAREKALATARKARLAAAPATGAALTQVALGSDGSAALGGGPRAGFGLPAWLSGLLPLALLLAGLFAIGQLTDLEQIQVAADIDAQLLADDLPPAAYADPGFVQYLRRGPSQ